MKPQPDISRVVRSWLDEGTNRVPDRVLDSVLALVPMTPQRRPLWLVRRFPSLSNPFRIAIAAAAIVVASVVAINLLPRGGVGTTPSPSPTASPVLLDRVNLDSPVTAGRYRVESTFALPFSISFPSSWTLKALSKAETNFVRSTPSNAATWVTVDLVDGVVIDPCHAEAGTLKSPQLSMTVDGVVEAITHMVGFSAGPVSDVQIGGYPGKAVVITNAIDTETAGCTYGPMLPLWTWPGSAPGGGTNGGATESVSVVDVRGTIVVIDGESFPTTPKAALDEVPGIVQSITFE